MNWYTTELLDCGHPPTLLQASTGIVRYPDGHTDCYPCAELAYTEWTRTRS